MPVKLGYWNIRGLAQPIRLQMKYLGIEFEDVYYVLGGPPDFDYSSWLKVKETLGMPFPNLPYLIDGDVKLSQSFAILKYLSRKARKLMPTTEQEQQNTDMMEGVLTYVDFSFYEILDHHRVFEPALLEGFPVLKEYLDRFEALPNIKGYVESEECRKLSVNNFNALWIGYH